MMISMYGVAWFVRRSVYLRLSFTTVSPTKRLKRLRCRFGCGLMGPRNHVVDGVQIPTREGTMLRAEMGRSGHVRT